jgi:CDP-glycerol glycerophosphotransferase (TagB/SpsB family)
MTGNDFWKKKTTELEELKTRQAEYNDSVPTKPRVIFYESMSGARMMDSPYALFLRLYRDPAYREFHHVWSVRTHNLIPEEFKDDPRVTFVARGTDAHMYFLALAGYIIGNSLLPDYFVRKPDQKYLNTWHGIAYKALGRTEASPLGAAGSVYNLLQASHVLTPCPLMTEVELSRFSLRGVFSGSLAEVGYPRQDLTINMANDETRRIATELGLDPAKKTVLYAPTWRGNKGTARFDAEQLERDIRHLSELDANVVFQAHHIMLRHIKNVDYGNIIVPPTNIVTNELLAVGDLLISDYSSIFFDFLATGKPIVHYLYDYQAYADERGVLLDQSELPGPIVTTGEDLIDTVGELIAAPYSPTARYQQAQERFCPHDDGSACDRTIKWFIHGDDDAVELVEARKRPSIVYWGGRLDKGKKTSDFLDSVRAAAERGDKDVTLFVAHSVKSNGAAMTQIRELGDSVSVIARNDFEMIMTSAEEAARNPDDKSAVSPPPGENPTLLNRLTSLFRRPADPVESERELLSSIYEREYRRIFGDSKFDEVVVFSGASHFWKKLAEHARR